MAFAERIPLFHFFFHYFVEGKSGKYSKNLVIFDIELEIPCESNHWLRLASWSSRSSLPEVFWKKCVLKNFAKFTGNHLCQSLFFDKDIGFVKKEALV